MRRHDLVPVLGTQTPALQSSSVVFIGQMARQHSLTPTFGKEERGGIALGANAVAGWYPPDSRILQGAGRAPLWLLPIAVV